MRRLILRTAALACALLALATGVAFATGAVSLADETIRACVQQTTGAVRISDSCRVNERATTWSVQGPQGIQGIQGIQGLPGPPGPAGGPPEPHTQVLGTLTISGITPAGASIDVRGVHLEVTNSGTSSTGGGAGAGKAVIGALEVTKGFDAASTELYKSAATGRHHPSASLALAVGGAAPYLTIDLTDVLVTKVAHDALHETVALTAASTAAVAGTGPAPASPGPDRGDLTIGTLNADVLALGWSVTQSAVTSGGGGGGAGKAEIAPVAVTIPASASGGAALEAVATGRHEPSATIAATGRTYALADALVTGWELSGLGAAGAPPTIELTVDARELAETVGATSFCFSKVTNTTC